MKKNNNNNNNNNFYVKWLDWSWDWNESSHFIKILSHFDSDIESEQNWKLLSHRDLISSHLMKKKLISFWFCKMLRWDQNKTQHFISCQEILLFYNIHINIKATQFMNSSFYSSQWAYSNDIFINWIFTSILELFNCQIAHSIALNELILMIYSSIE